jgi:hypothetical protein
MGAFNYIVVQAHCPACNTDTDIECQCHIASSFNGDERGWFCHKEYRLGEKMLWWPEGDARHSLWCSNDVIDGKLVEEFVTHGDSSLECCYSECTQCKAELFAVIRFRDIAPVELVEVGLEKDWPEGFLM